MRIELGASFFSFADSKRTGSARAGAMDAEEGVVRASRASGDWHERERRQRIATYACERKSWRSPLRQAGELVNHKRVERLYALEKLQVRRRRREKIPLAERWSGRLREQ